MDDNQKQANSSLSGGGDGIQPSSGNTDDSGVAPVRKPKTPEQQARERERRRRRRKKKQTMPAPGQDVPLILPAAKASQAAADAPQDAPIEPQAGLPEIQEPPDLSVLPQAESFEVFPVETEFNETEPMEPPPAPAELSPAQQVFEQPVASEPPSPEPPLPEPPSLTDDEVLTEQARLEEAKKLSQNLLSPEQPVLEELPQKQGVLGKVFDLLAKLVQGREPEKVQIVAAAPTLSVEDGKPGLLLRLLKVLLGLVVLIALAIGAFWIGSTLKLVDYFHSFFQSRPGLELIQGNNEQVVMDPEMQGKWGFLTALTFGRNGGNLRDNTYNFIFNASYFGHLRDPQFIGETGITAALYYGFGREYEYVKNRFILYVQEIEKVRLANSVNVQQVMSGKTRRDEALDKYIADTRAVFERANQLRKEINVLVDDLKISINTLNPDKDKYETDFFAALEQMQGEKADILLKKFVESSQKQVDLKARLAALSRLAAYFEDDLILMKIRLEAIEKNREALISGVTVTEIPGVDLNLIRP